MSGLTCVRGALAALATIAATSAYAQTPIKLIVGTPGWRRDRCLCPRHRRQAADVA